MQFCSECGGELNDGVKFCKHCGARVGDLADGPVEPKFFMPDGDTSSEEEMIPASEFFADASEDDFAEIEDGEVDDSKGLDPNRTYHMTFSGQRADLYDDHAQLIRRFNMRRNVVQATTSGEFCSICTDDGWTHVYRWTGEFMRRFH